MFRILLLLKKSLLIVFCAVLTVGLIGCMSAETGDLPKIPDRLERNEDGVPVLSVYNEETKETERMNIEEYVMGVVAGEMRDDWPIEALKAQAILARTFTMKFLTDKQSRYAGADISTDVREAQAYNAEAVNDRIRQAVSETSGIVLTSNGEFVNAWFHAHAGGRTELPTKALDYSVDPEYLRVKPSMESDEAPEEVRHWTAEFALEEIEEACRASGVDVGNVRTFEIGETGQSDRAVSFLVNGKKVSAPTFRIQIGASELKSTRIDSVSLNDGKVIFTGSGFGHGVGMSQWGAYAMAKDGKRAEEIVQYYFDGVELNRLW